MGLDKENDLRLREQYELGNSAKKAMDYFESWIAKKRNKIVKEMASATSQEAVLTLWPKLKAIDELEKDLLRDIQTGELALDEMEEEGI